MRLVPGVRHFLGLFFLLASSFSSAQVNGAGAIPEPWSLPSFKADAAALRAAAATVAAEKRTDATVLLNDQRYSFDAAGAVVETEHLIYRIETANGVEGWAETSGVWEPWHQSKPEIRARVISAEGVEHWLDAKTLTDVPVHEDEPEVYSDNRRYGGPLPAIAIGSIVEEEIVTRDTSPLFAAGLVERIALSRQVAVQFSRVEITHPKSLPLHWRLNLLPEAKVSERTANGLHVVLVTQGRLAAITERLESLPSDVLRSPQVEFSTGTSWRAVADEYARLSEEKLRTAEVQSLLGKVNLKDASRLEKIRHIVTALHKNVRYTGVEFGQASLVPQPPAETLKRKYGDCKDKAALLVTLLRAAGIPANLALLDTGPGQDINSDLPGVGLFDHAIVYVPPSGSEPELWIDATAQFSSVGSLPWMDYGRKALVIGNDAQPLKSTPVLTAEMNTLRETREFTLSDFGLASIREINQGTGTSDGYLREYYSSDSKEVREGSESYVKNAYLADSLLALEHSDLTDLEKPATVTLVTKGRRGTTDLTWAVAAIRTEALFNRLPNYFQTREEPAKQEADAEEKKPERTQDWEILPAINEWQYKIVAPEGFKLRALPENKQESLEGIQFTQRYSANAEGTVVEATLRVENRLTRLTVEQARKLRDAVVKARSADPILITFDQQGSALISAGKVKEGLAFDRQLAARHPKEALHRVRLADALRSVGLGEEARAVAQEAVKLEPKSALAYRTLGAALKYDLIGRLLGKGMDFKGAVAAYRRSLELDAKDKDTHANLALLLEYNAEGERYGAGAPLREALAELKELKKLDEDYEAGYEDNALYDLWYANDPKGLLEYAAALPANDTRRGLVLAATALLNGTPAAVAKSLVIASDEAARKKALSTAGVLLIRLRKYAEAGEIYAEAARGTSDEQGLARSAGLLAKTKRIEDMKLDPSDARSVIVRVLGGLMGGSITPDEFRALTYGTLDSSGDPLEKQLERHKAQNSVAIARSGTQPIVATDIALSTFKVTLEGNDELGYKAIAEFPGSAAMNLYLFRDGNRLRLLAFNLSDGKSVEGLGEIALHELELGQLAAARKWLDRARESMHQNGGDDPLSGAPFPYFWTKGQEADEATTRTAALILLDSRLLTAEHAAALAAARATTKSDAEKNRINMVLAYGYQAHEQWEQMLATSLGLVKALPTSARALNLAVSACVRIKRYEDCDAAVERRMKEAPDELDAVRSLARLQASRVQYAAARATLKGIMEKGQATATDLNLYSWYALFVPGAVDNEAREAAVRANELTQKSNYAILHTLACVDGVAGRSSQARAELLRAMESNNLQEPDSSLWLGFALAAEQDGELDAARRMYEKVEKPKQMTPADSYVLAQQHLAALKTEPAKHSH